MCAQAIDSAVVDLDEARSADDVRECLLAVIRAVVPTFCAHPGYVAQLVDETRCWLALDGSCRSVVVERMADGRVCLEWMDHKYVMLP